VRATETLEFSTAGLPPRERRRAWEKRLSDACGWSPYSAITIYSNDEFSAAMSVRDLAGITIGRYAHNALETHVVERSRRGCAPGERSMFLVMPVKRPRVVRQQNRETLIEPKTLMVIDDAAPFTYRYERCADTIVARLPTAQLLRANLEGQAPLGGVHTYALPENAGIAALVRSTLLTIVRSMDRFDEADAARARDTLINLVRGALEREWRPRPDLEQKLPERRVRAFIDARLADPDLSPATISAGCGISVRRLHRIFAETEWSVSDWIRKRRLERCREELLDPAFDTLSITQIAFRWGFNDAAHFSKKFREAYNQTPRSVRNGGSE
jgi:AraC-like DNA-binding protein